MNNACHNNGLVTCNLSEYNTESLIVDHCDYHASRVPCLIFSVKDLREEYICSCIANDRQCVSVVVKQKWQTYRKSTFRLVFSMNNACHDNDNGLVTRLTRRISLVEQELLTLLEHLCLPPVVLWVRVTRSLV